MSLPALATGGGCVRTVVDRAQVPDADQNHDPQNMAFFSLRVDATRKWTFFPGRTPSRRTSRGLLAPPWLPTPRLARDLLRHTPTAACPRLRKPRKAAFDLRRSAMVP